MNNFLEKIKATEKLKSELANGELKVFANNDTHTSRVLISNVKHLSPKSNIELYSKAIDIFNQMDLKIEFINFELDAINDTIFTYENIREFILMKKLMINLSDLILLPIEDSLVIKVSKHEANNQLLKHLDELKDYLSYFSVSNKQITLEVDPTSLAADKLEEEVQKDKNVIYESKEILDETIRPKHKLVDLDLNGTQRNVYFEGFIFSIDTKKAKTGTNIYNIAIGNKDQAVNATIFDKELKGFGLSKGDPIRLYGMYEFDEFKKAYVLKAFSVNSIQKISYNTLTSITPDSTSYARNEFHVHTKMSTLDGIANPKDYIKYAEAYNLDSITITDHNSVQSFPDAYASSKETKVKFNYGVEFDVYNDLTTHIVINEREQNLIDAEYVFFDLETTSVSAYLNEIIEFGAVKYKNNKVIDRKQIFIKPEVEISKFTTELTSITNDDVANAPRIDEIINEIKEWIGDAILVAHNASFDYSFLNKAYIDNGLGEIKNPIIDSMKLSWLIHPKSRSHRLGQLAKYELIPYDPNAAHRADYDAEILCKIYERLLHKLITELEVRDLSDLNKLDSKLTNYYFAKHITMVSKNQDGLKDLNRFVSWANVDYFNTKKKTAMLPLSLFFDKDLFKNVLIGSSCSNGLIFDAIMNDDVKLIDSIIGIYDYLEVFPPTSYKNLISNKILDWKQLQKIIRRIIKLGQEHNIPVIASSNAHYAGKVDKKFRDVIISAQRVGGLSHPLHNFRNPKSEKPDAHLRSTSEMFEEFGSFLDANIVEDIVINNPAKLQSMIEEQVPIKSKLYPPKIEGSEEELIKMIDDNIEKLYGTDVHQSIQDRINRELKPIIDHGFSIIYYLSAIAVKKSMDDGYLVGSRGSVGSSIVATLSGITEVNPLKPHYRCEKCKHHEFNSSVDSGFDLPSKPCPVCGDKMVGDGHSIPFETFLGFNADKVPDIDLNFSRDNQSSIHLYMKEVLGEDNIYRAGTISTAAFKTSIGYVKNYEESNGKNFNKATVDWLATKIEGAKRTTGQHPGGLIVIPQDMEVYDFTPINYPGDDASADWKTTHFDFHSIHDNLLKLDLLGHLDPSTIRMLQNLTNVDPQTIPMNDKNVISLFESNKVLNYIEDFTGEKLGIIGLPEFGTNFVRELVREAKPKSFADLVRISGLSHGTDVWTGNAQKLIKDGTAILSEVISVRDDILTYLIDKGMDESMAFNIMESVRKGKGLTAEWEESMIANNVPDWYIESCKAIKYMFPKAHATAYVMMAYRIAWYKINYPLEYYATFFSKRDIELDLSRLLKGIPEMKKHIEEIKQIPRFERTKKDDDLVDTYNIVFEMYSRGIEFSNIDVNKSGSINYIVDKENNKLIPPFSILEGIGTTVAKGATKKRKEKEYTSQTDFKLRSGFPSKTVNVLVELGIFKELNKDEVVLEQLSLFE